MKRGCAFRALPDLFQRCDCVPEQLVGFGWAAACSAVKIEVVLATSAETWSQQCERICSATFAGPDVVE